MTSMDSLVAFSNQTEARDKFCKAIQYSARILQWYLKGKNDDAAKRFTSLFTSMRDARKLFRLFKSLNEYHKILQFLKEKGGDPIKQSLNILSRSSFMLYWFFDNLNILGHIKFIDIDAKKMGKNGMFFWFLALVFSLILYSFELVGILQYEMKILNERINFEDQKDYESRNKRIAEIEKKKTTVLLNIAKTIGDLIPAANGWELPMKLFGKGFNDGWVGLGGLVSSIITLYQLYPSKK